MKKKPIIATAAMLIILLVLPSIAQAGTVHFNWDFVWFVDGTDIDYAHPDNVLYGISPSSDWMIQGLQLYHHQINRDTTTAIVVGTVIFIEILELVISAKLGGGNLAQIVGGLAGIVISTYIGMVLDWYFVDERGCMWWSIGKLFTAYLEANLPYLGNPLYKEAALSAILSAWITWGYLRVGTVTFWDAFGKGGPGPPCDLTISTTLWGQTTPIPGTYTYEHDTPAYVFATPWENCGVFDYWILDGTKKYENPIYVTMGTGHSLKAYFHNSSPSGGGGETCPTLFAWDGNAYVDYGVINIHNSTGEDVVKEVPIQAEDIDISNHKAVLRLREGWEGLNFSESVIDQVTLYAIGNDGNRHLCPLIRAEHSSSGNVLPKLLHSDEWKVQIVLLETIDLTFAVSYENVQDFAFVIEGCNQIKW